MTFYDYLCVPEKSSFEELKAAYRKRAKDLHPDTGGDETSFKELQRIWAVLGNPTMRAKYDHWLAQKRQPKVPPSTGTSTTITTSFGTITIVTSWGTEG